MRIFLITVAAFIVQASQALASSQSWNPAMGVYSQTAVSPTTVYVQAIARNLNRDMLWINNGSAASTLTVRFGDSTVSTGLIIPAGETFVAPLVDSVYVKSSAGVVPVTIIEGIN